MFLSTSTFAFDVTAASPVEAPPKDIASSASQAVELALISDRAAFDALEDDWNALFERAGKPTNVFQTFNWNWHWANAYLGSSPGGIAGLELAIVTGRRNGKLIMVFPLVKERVRGITQIFWMGHPVSQYGDVLVDNLADTQDVLRQGWTFLVARAKGDMVRLRRVRADAAIAPLLQEMGATVTDRLIAPYLDLASAPSFDDYEKRYSGGTRRNRKRLRRRLEERGAMTFERHHGGAEAAKLAVEALDLKAAWLKERGLVSNAIADARMARLFADAADGKGRSTGCCVSALKSEGETAALEVSFDCKGRHAIHVIVYNLKFEKAGAGVVLMEQSLRDCFAEGAGAYDLLAPGDSYKLDWADNSVEVLDWVQPLSLAGHVYTQLYLGSLRGKAKAALKALPQPLRRAVSRGVSKAA